MEKENKLEKVGSFVSSTISKIVNAIILVLIIALVCVIAWFWHNNVILVDKNETLQKQVEELKIELKKIEEEKKDLEVKNVKDKENDKVVEGEKKELLNKEKSWVENKIEEYDKIDIQGGQNEYKITEIAGCYYKSSPMYYFFSKDSAEYGLGRLYDNGGELVCVVKNGLDKKGCEDLTVKDDCQDLLWRSRSVE